MATTYRVLTPKDLDTKSSLRQQFAVDVLIGLSESPKKLSSKYFYDNEGSQIFAQITELSEYYLTRCEQEILETHKEIIADLIEGQRFNLVELGAGDGRKTRLLLEHFLDRQLEFRYIPIDISESAMKGWVESLGADYPELETQGLVCEYFEGLKWLSSLSGRKNLILFLGSNIGNFNVSEARTFLYSLWNVLHQGDYLLTGFDLKKDIELLRRAYNDSKGITRNFNLNLLTRINQELGGNFDLSKFQYNSVYDVFTGAMESYLVSTETQTVMIEELRQSFTFEAWEPIHTEFSYKYLESDITMLADQTGFSIVAHLFDSKHFFVDSIWKVEKHLITSDTT